LLYAQDFREIIIEYHHSRRIPYNSIILRITKNKIFVKTSQMEDKTGYEYTNMETEMEITEIYFKNLYNKFININYSEIIDNSKDIHGLDGETFYITIGTFQNNIRIELWTPGYEKNNRGTNEFLNLIYEVFLLFKLETFFSR
jgi:hypothetical protein